MVFIPNCYKLHKKAGYRSRRYLREARIMAVTPRITGGAIPWVVVLITGMFLAIPLAYFVSMGFPRTIESISPVILGLYALAALVTAIFAVRVMNILFGA